MKQYNTQQKYTESIHEWPCKSMAWINKWTRRDTFLHRNPVVMLEVHHPQTFPPHASWAVPITAFQRVRSEVGKGTGNHDLSKADRTDFLSGNSGVKSLLWKWVEAAFDLRGLSSGLRTNKEETQGKSQTESIRLQIATIVLKMVKVTQKQGSLRSWCTQRNREVTGSHS